MTTKVARKEQDRIVLKADRYRYVDGLLWVRGSRGVSKSRHRLIAERGTNALLHPSFTPQQDGRDEMQTGIDGRDPAEHVLPPVDGARRAGIGPGVDRRTGCERWTKVALQAVRKPSAAHTEGRKKPVLRRTDLLAALGVGFDQGAVVGRRSAAPGDGLECDFGIKDARTASRAIHGEARLRDALSIHRSEKAARESVDRAADGSVSRQRLGRTEACVIHLR